MHCGTIRAHGRQSAGLKAVYLCSKTGSSWRGQTTASSIASNRSCPAGGGGFRRFHFTQAYASLHVIKENSSCAMFENYFFVEPSSDDHRTVRVSFGSMTSFPKRLHLSIAFLLHRGNCTSACNNGVTISLLYSVHIWRQASHGNIKQTLMTGKYEMVATLDAWLILSWSSILQRKYRLKQSGGVRT